MKPRHATRTVLLDNAGGVAIIHVEKLGYYKIPGGGVEAGEDSQSAAKREVFEEAGCDCEIIAELGRIENDLLSWGMRDISDGFLAQLIGKKNQPHFEYHEAERGFTLEWCESLDAAIAKIEQNFIADPEAAILQARDLAYIKRAKAYLKQCDLLQPLVRGRK